MKRSDGMKKIFDMVTASDREVRILGARLLADYEFDEIMLFLNKYGRRIRREILTR